ncbi:hypothetical protein AAMO2058_000304200 [Amorphochlora amoebiformis]
MIELVPSSPLEPSGDNSNNLSASGTSGPSIPGIGTQERSTASMVYAIEKARDYLDGLADLIADLAKTGKGGIHGFGTQASGSQASGSQASGTQASGTQASGTQASGTQASGTQASGTQASGTQASGTQASGTQASGTQTSGTQTTGTQDSKFSYSSTPQHLAAIILRGQALRMRRLAQKLLKPKDASPVDQIVVAFSSLPSHSDHICPRNGTEKDSARFHPKESVLEWMKTSICSPMGISCLDGIGLILFWPSHPLLCLLEIISMNIHMAAIRDGYKERSRKSKIIRRYRIMTEHTWRSKGRYCLDGIRGRFSDAKEYELPIHRSFFKVLGNRDYSDSKDVSRASRNLRLFLDGLNPKMWRGC